MSPQVAESIRAARHRKFPSVEKAIRALDRLGLPESAFIDTNKLGRIERGKQAPSTVDLGILALLFDTTVSALAGAEAAQEWEDLCTLIGGVRSR
jgi:transcriptional regulator with XRE-family HTH domain